jgi:mannose-1-phosphate guanylyltransferase
VVTEKDQAPLIRDLLPDLPGDQLIVEPLGKNTAPCIGLAARLLAARDPEAVMAILPADHYIAREADFRRVLAAAGEAARSGAFLITLGISPVFPETGYGYIEKGPERKILPDRPVWAVRAFHEKPDRARAETMLASGGFFWNSGMFVWGAAAILEKLAQYAPDMDRELRGLPPTVDHPDWDSALLQAYERMEDISIDYAVMEKADNVLMLEGDFGWNDVGSWEAVYQLAAKDEQGNCLQGPAVIRESTGCLVFSPQKTVALLGVQNLVVVETPDALLICPREKSQEVKKIVELLEKKGATALL